MSDDLDQLLRDTLHGRAATVTHAPPVPDHAETGRGHLEGSRRLLVAATAVAVLVVGGGVAYLAGQDRAPTPAVGDAPSACSIPLPTSWRSAIAPKALTVDGRQASPAEGSADGAVVLDTFSKGGADTVYLRGKDGRSSTLTTIADDRAFKTTSWDGRYLAFGSAPRIPADSPNEPINDITVIDTRTHHTLHVLAGAPVPHGWMVGRGEVVVRDGIVYWGATPTAETESGIVLSYDIAHDRYRVVARLGVYPSVQPDPRGGVAWPGGTVGRRIAPADVPPVIDAAGNIPAYVVTDNRSWAWTYRTHDRTTITWASADGAGRQFVVDPVHDVRFPPLLSAANGPLVFFGLDGHGTDSYVLDTRTGAVASTGDAEYESVAPGRLFERSSQDAAYHEVDVARLPELRCR